MSAAVLLTGKEELLSYFGIPDVRYQLFETYYTIRKLNDGCLEDGDKLFRAIFKRLHLNDITFRESARDRPMKIDHYNLKGYFYRTADFGISYSPDDSRRGDVKTSIKFRVTLKGVKIGGSLNYEDLGLEDDKDVEKFVKEFAGLEGIRPVEEAIRFISQRIIDKKGQQLYRAMAREIQEESTPDRTVAKSISEIAKGLRLVGFRLDQRAAWQTVVDFEFESSDRYVKAREMDEFCCKMGKMGMTSVYFIYGGGAGRVYMTQLPYIVRAASPVAVVKKSVPKIAPMAVTVNYMKSLSPARREEAKGVVSSFKPARVPRKPRAIAYVPTHMYSVEGVRKRSASASAERARIHSLREAKESLGALPLDWKPIEPYLDVLRDYDTDSDEEIVYLKKKQRTKKRSPTGPQRKTVRRTRDKKESSK